MQHDLTDLLEKELNHITENGPSYLQRAMVHAVFPGGGRVRPKLLLAIVESISGKAGETALAAAAAVELIHCASLVHDDMPCFDDAYMRRGKPSVHKAFGEGTALLVGDGLIAAAFEVLARRGADHPRLAELVRILARATGASDGLVSGQAWEDDPEAPVTSVHQKKTGALFEAAAAMAAVVADVDDAQWRVIGKHIGAAYQIADDVMDTIGSIELAGKPIHQDVSRPVANAVKTEGLDRAFYQFRALVQNAVDEIPSCPGRSSLANLVTNIAERLIPLNADQWEAQKTGTVKTAAASSFHEVG